MKKLIVTFAAVMVVVGIVRVVNLEKSCVSEIRVSSSGYLQEDDNRCGRNYAIINNDEVAFDLYGYKSKDAIPGDKESELIMRLQPKDAYKVNGDGYYGYSFSQNGKARYWVTITK